MLIEAADESLGRVIGQRDKRTVIGVDQMGIVARQAGEDGIQAWLGLNKGVPLGHQFSIAFLDGVASLGLKDVIDLLAQLEKTWGRLFVVAAKSVFETVMPTGKINLYTNKYPKISIPPIPKITSQQLITNNFFAFITPFQQLPANHFWFPKPLHNIILI